MLDHSLYDAFLSADFIGDGCTGNSTLVTDAVSETILVACEEWGVTTVNCGVNSDGDVG